MSDAPVVQEAVLADFAAHAILCAPKESIGVVAEYLPGEQGLSLLTNVAEDPCASFLAEPVAQQRTLRRIEREGGVVVAICHSHPRGRPWPSIHDVCFAALWPIVHVIYSLPDDQALEYRLDSDNEIVCRGYHSRDGHGDFRFLAAESREPVAEQNDDRERREVGHDGDRGVRPDAEDYSSRPSESHSSLLSASQPTDSPS